MGKCVSKLTRPSSKRWSAFPKYSTPPAPSTELPKHSSSCEQPPKVVPSRTSSAACPCATNRAASGNRKWLPGTHSAPTWRCTRSTHWNLVNDHRCNGSQSETDRDCHVLWMCTSVPTGWMRERRPADIQPAKDVPDAIPHCHIDLFPEIKQKQMNQMTNGKCYFKW